MAARLKTDLDFLAEWLVRPWVHFANEDVRSYHSEAVAFATRLSQVPHVRLLRVWFGRVFHVVHHVPQGAMGCRHFPLIKSIG